MADPPVAPEMAWASLQGWKTFIVAAARQLEVILGPPGPRGAPCCAICDTPMEHGVADHLASQSHWRSLCALFGRDDPAALSQVRLAFPPWEQRFATPKGTYIFNHMTGRQGYDDAIAAGWASCMSG